MATRIAEAAGVHAARHMGWHGNGVCGIYDWPDRRQVHDIRVHGRADAAGCLSAILGKHRWLDAGLANI